MRVVNEACHQTVALFAAILAAIALAVTPVSAQTIETVDPDAILGEIDGDIVEQPGDQPVYADEQPIGTVAAASTPEATSDPQPSFGDQMATGSTDPQVAPTWADPVVTGDGQVTSMEDAARAAEQSGTYKEDDLIGAAQDVFGKGAEGVAGMIKDLLAKQGEPNGYIVGREAGGAFIVGARYGSGTLYHKVEGERQVYWTGPSIGFDAGANAGKTFVLVYNLYDTEELFKRFPAGEGQAYIVGGLTASYVRRGDTVLIPIRVGAGLRLGVNAGYMRFSKKQRWLPF